MIHEAVNVNGLSSQESLLDHFSLFNTVVFQGKGNVLSYRQADKLAVRVLQDCSHTGRKLKDRRIICFKAIYLQLTCYFTVKRKRYQSVDTVTDSALSGTGGSADQDLFAGIDVQVDVLQRRLFLSIVLKSKILETDDWVFTHVNTSQ